MEEFIFIINKNLTQLKENSINKGLYGYELSNELAQYLGSQAVPIEEDWGWLTFIKEFHSGIFINICVVGQAVDNVKNSSTDLEFRISLDTHVHWITKIKSIFNNYIGLEKEIKTLEEKITDFVTVRGYKLLTYHD